MLPVFNGYQAAYDNADCVELCYTESCNSQATIFSISSKYDCFALEMDFVGRTLKKVAYLFT